MSSKKIYLLGVFILFFACTTSSKPKYDVLNYASDKDDASYSDYLVDLTSYTSNGKEYHQKYEQYLYGIAKILVEEKKIKVVSRSIGFYFDKRSSTKNMLYLGVDIDADPSRVRRYLSYVGNGRNMMRIYVTSILEVLHSCVDVLQESEVKGMLIGIHWKNGRKERSITVWLDKDDVRKYYTSQLTLRELIIRNIVTNTEGEIVRLTL